jgi:hypothetical protein
MDLEEISLSNLEDQTGDWLLGKMVNLEGYSLKFSETLGRGVWSFSSENDMITISLSKKDSETNLIEYLSRVYQTLPYSGGELDIEKSYFSVRG